MIPFAGLLFLAFLSLGLTEKDNPFENVEFDPAEKRALQAVVPDAEWGKPVYLYSRTGNPYRCFIRNTDGLPLACRKALEGDEIIEAMRIKV